MVDWSVYQGAVWGFHCTNILLHITATLLCYYFIRSVFKFIHSNHEAGFPYGWIGAFVFALHPINTQPVSHIISRSNILAVIAFLAGMIVSMNVWKRLIDRARVRKNEFWIYSLTSIVCGFFVFLGAGAKEIIVTLPVMCILLFWIENQVSGKYETRKILLSMLLPFGIVLCCFFFLRYLTGGSILSIPDAEVRSPYINLLTQITVIGTYYIPRLLIPIHLQYDPQFDLVTTIFDSRILLSFIVIGSIGFLGYQYRKRFPLLFYGILWFFITIGPHVFIYSSI